MISEVRTVMWKEGRGLSRQPGGKLRLALTIVTPIFFFGVFAPWSQGEAWFDSEAPVLAATVVSLVVAMMTAPDLFAGERERRTLATLLTTRLSDRAILIGKAASATVVAWAFGVGTVLIGLLTGHVVHWEGRVRVLTTASAAAVLVLSLLVAGVTVGVGIIVSMHSPTVQQAQQLVAALLLLPLTLLGPVVLLIAEANPGWSVGDLLGDIGAVRLLLFGISVLLVLNIGLFAVTAARFHRDSLIGGGP